MTIMHHTSHFGRLMTCLPLVIGLFVAVPTAHAATIVVTTDGEDDFGMVDCTLRNAIWSAENDVSLLGACADGSGADEIVFAAGAGYTLTLIDGQLPAITSDITITGRGAGTTIIQANASPNTATYRVFGVDTAGSLTLNDLTVRHGKAAGVGGGISSLGTLNLNNVHVEDNLSSSPGGGIYATGTTNLTGCQISNNQSGSNSYGGGIYAGGTTNITGAMVSNNHSDWDGGGIINTGALTIDRSTISGNSGRYGGGIENYGNITLTNSTVSSNYANQDGGGISSWGPITAENSTISGNIAADDGGGLDSISATVTLTNCTISGNVAQGTVHGFGGGGIIQRQDGSAATLQLINTTIAGNSSDTAGGDGILIMAGTATLANSIIADNGEQNCAGATFNSLGHNLDSDNTCSLAGTGDLPNTDPMLDVLADNGGETWTMALQWGSAAIDAGDNGACPATDQRGVTRPQYLHCDIGAFEYTTQQQTGPAFEVNSNTDSDDGQCTYEDCTLREAIDAANSYAGGVATITFAGDYTITLAGSQLPAVTAELTITGNGAGSTILQASTCDPVNLPGACTPAAHRVLEVGTTGNLTLDGVTVRNGYGDTRGGGVYAQGTLDVRNSLIANNVATQYGSAIFSSGALDVSTTTFSGNYCLSSDGGGTLANFGTATVQSSTFDNNSAPDGGGGGIYSALSTTLNLYNSTFANNSAAQGGAIHNRGAASIGNNTFASNEASGRGRVIHNWNGTLSLYNNLMANNTGTALNTCDDEGALSTSINNLIDDGTCSASLTVDPLLGALADNGGPTWTMALLAGSPALEAGDDATCATVDQRGVSRPYGSHCDIGAYESQGGYAQTISFGPLADKGYGSGSVILTATASSGLAVSYASTTPGVCTVFVNNIVILGGVGNCSITASQAGDALYNPAPDVIQSFMVNMADQSITFAPLADKAVTDPDFTISASASSGLLVMFSTVTTSVCSLSNNTVTLQGPGTCTITASQPGNWFYNPAQSVDQSFTVVAGLGDSDGDSVDDAIDVDDDGDGLIEIGSLADLDEIRNDLFASSLYGSAAGCPTGGCVGVELTTDLDFDTNGDGAMDAGDDYWNGGEGWLPIGDVFEPFSGTFEGNGHAIRNLFIDRASGIQMFGLFGSIFYGGIANLTMSGPLTSVTGESYGAILVGYIVGSTIENCVITGGTVSVIFDGGPIAGVLIDSTLSNSFSAASVASVEGESGGLVAGASNSIITNCLATGSVSGSTSGGLVGYNSGSVISSSYAIGLVNGNVDSGGLVGANDASGESVVASYWDTETTGQAATADDMGTGLTTAELQCPTGPDDSTCVSGTILYDGWDSAVWDFGTVSQYPALIVNGKVYRDCDGDGIWDFDDDAVQCGSRRFPWEMFLPAIISNGGR